MRHPGQAGNRPNQEQPIESFRILQQTSDVTKTLDVFCFLPNQLQENWAKFSDT
jgi:hypothetical protein